MAETESRDTKSTRPVFNAAVDATLAKCQAISSQRGGEYLDSWALENQVSTFMRATLREFGVTLSPEQMRLLTMAALVDVKESRMGGAFKDDSHIDAINYRSAYLELMLQYRGERA
jgi:hypothetical protein